MKDYKKIITEFYKKHNPEQLDRVDYFLKKYKGREEELILSLEKKYAKPGTGSKSSKALKQEKAPEKEKKVKKEDAPKPEASVKKEETKEAWAKRREEILKQVREQAENIKKKRVSSVSSSFKEKSETFIPPPSNNPEREVVPPVDYLEKEEALAAELVGSDEPEVAPTPPPTRGRAERAEAPTKNTRTVARYSEDEIKPKLKIPNPGAMTAAQRAAFWAEQLEVKDRLVMQRLSEKALNTKYDEPVPDSKTPKKAIKEAKPVAERAASIVPKKKRSFKKFFWISILALVLGGAVFAMWNAGFFSAKNEAVNDVVTDDGKPAKKTAIPPEGARESGGEGDESNGQPIAEPDKANEFGLSDNEEEEPEQMQPTVEEEVKPSADEEVRGSKNKTLTTPCFLVSYATLSNEDGAMSSAAELRSKGFKSGYYFIPDYVPGGKSLYKVYSGPFNTPEEAEETAERIRAFSEGAYVIYLQ